MTVAEVRLWGRRIGAISWSSAQRLASFEYADAFQSSGIEVSPLAMPLGPRIFQFPGLPDAAFHGLPGMLADSLPDRYGNALIDAWLTRQGRTRQSFDPLERLCYVGTRGMGALEYQPASGPERSAANIDVEALVGLANAVLAERNALAADLNHDDAAINQILQVGTSAGGARAKAVVAWNPTSRVIRTGQAGLEPGFSHWILKLDGVRSVDDREVGATQGYGRVEYAYSQMAHAAGIDMTECELLEEGGRAHFMTRRFDRSADGEKLHMQSLAALAHFDFNAAGAYSYEQAVDVMRRLALGQDAIGQQFRRTVFNVVARNQDDHVKNIAFLMDKGGRWSPSPAFDVTYAYNPAGSYTATHQMTINGKREHIALSDLLDLGRFCNIKTVTAKRIVAAVTEAVETWPRFADAAGLTDAQTRAIAACFRSLAN